MSPTPSASTTPMAAENPTALTWIFSYQFADPADTAPEQALVKTLGDLPFVQYLAFHVTEHSLKKSVFIRGIIRCHRPRSLLQLRDCLPLASFKPLRGMFSESVVRVKLHPRNRLSNLVEIGTLNPSIKKRPLQCNGLCPCCCTSNKRPAVVSDPPASSS